MTGLLPRKPCTIAAFVGAVALAATSCRRFQPAPLSPADSASALESRSLTDPELRALFEQVLPGAGPRIQLMAAVLNGLVGERAQ